MFRRKSLAQFAAEAAQEEEASEASLLSLFDLLCIGIGGTVGSGVFVLTGQVLPLCGPASALCWVLGGLVCLLSASSYMELSTRVPTRGSCYAYAFHALGEFAAVAGATSLTLEYGMSGAGIARSWSAKFDDLVGASAMFSSPLGLGAVRPDAARFFLDYDAALVQLACVLVVTAGASLSTRVINVFTVAKVALVVFMIGAGFAAGRERLFTSVDGFFASGTDKGASGVFMGTSLVFFGFIGFDEVVCMAARARTPKKALPRAIVGTLLGASLLSFLAQLALAKLYALDEHTPGDASFEAGFRDERWIVSKYVTEVGEVVLLPLVILLSFLPQPELCAAMSADGLVGASFARRRRVNGSDVFAFGCATTGAALTVVALAVPFAVLWNTINLGVLVGFNLTNASLISVRLGNGGAVRDDAADRLLTLFAAALTPAAAYVLWKGAGQAALRGEALGPAGSFALTAGALFLLAALKTLHLIALRCKPVDHDHEDFRAPFVPWLPGLALLCNFSLMAQYSWRDHAVLFVVYGLAYGAYFASKLPRRRHEDAEHDRPRLFAGNDQTEELASPFLDGDSDAIMR